jgi:signal transduction histidine kinase
MLRRWALPAGLMAVPVALAVAVVMLSLRTGLWASTWTLLVPTLVGAVVGALLAGPRPGSVIGWLLLASGVPFLVGMVAEQVAYLGLVTSPGSALGATAALWLSNWIFPPALIPLFVFVPLTFPDGRLPSRRWMPVVVSSVAFAVVLVVFGAFGTNSLLLQGQHWPNPYVVPGLSSVGPAVITAATLGVLACCIAAVASLLVRWRSADPRVRSQIMWVVLALLVMAIGFGVDAALALLAPTLYPTVFPVLQLVPVVVPVAIAIAVLRHQLFDIEIVVRRLATYLALTAVLLAIYVAAAVGVAAVLPGSDGPARLVATALVAVAFAPVRDRLQSVIGRRLYGDRRRPYSAFTRLARELQTPSSPEAVMSTLVGSTAQALASPYVAIERTHGPASSPARVEYGQRPADDELLSVDLRHGGRQVGMLVVARRGHEDFSTADVMLLTDLAMPIGAALQAVDVSVELHRSRERLLLAIEEERRRLGRDLHDDLGPRLAVISMQVEAAHDLVLVDPDRARVVLSGLLDLTEQAVREVRQMAHDHRPPTLDALGLVTALRAHVADLAAVPARVQAPEHLPPLPAAVEVAAYRIALEALQNVAAHAHATSCVLRLSHDGSRLTVEVEDDGVGIPAGHPVGLGLQSLAERAGELGGVLTLDTGAGGTGTVVRASLPCLPRRAPEPDPAGPLTPAGQTPEWRPGWLP